MLHLVREADQRVLDAMCHLSFASFLQACFHIGSPGSQFRMNWHIHATAYHLEQVRVGENNRLILNMPPGTLKSFIASVAWPAFILGHDPTKRIAVISYGSELTVDLGNYFRQVVTSPWYQRLFPRMKISSVKNTEFEVMTTQNGFRLGTTVEGALTGLHADIIIIDDPIKPMDASSDVKRERVNTWFNKTLISQLNDPREGAIVVVMQRLHEGDLPGWLSRSSREWTVLSLAAIAEAEEWIPISDHQQHLRHVGEALHPERETVEELHRKRAQVGPETFAAQWQQCPIPAGGTIIKREWLHSYDQLPPSALSSPILQAWDLAAKAGEANDWSVCTTWRYHDGKYYLLHVFRQRLLYPLLRDHAIAHARSYRAKIILLEDDILGNALAAEMKKAGLSVTLMPLDRSKQMRVQIQTAKFRDGRVLFPRGASFLPELISEVLAFPRGRFDDQVDSIALALSHDVPVIDYKLFNTGLDTLIRTCAFQRMFGAV